MDTQSPGLRCSLLSTISLFGRFDPFIVPGVRRICFAIMHAAHIGTGHLDTVGCLTGSTRLSYLARDCTHCILAWPSFQCHSSSSFWGPVRFWLVSSATDKHARTLFISPMARASCTDNPTVRSSAGNIIGKLLPPL